MKGDAVCQNLPIICDILKGMFLKLNLYSSLDHTFWAACLVGFFSFFRKPNLLVQSHTLFDPACHLCATDVRFTENGTILTVRWSKIIQFRERTLQIPLPKILNCPFCPSTVLLHLALDNSLPSSAVPLFRYHLLGASNAPLTQKQFTGKTSLCFRSHGFPSCKLLRA